MPRYQVEYRAYSARYESDPPDWTVAPRSSTVLSMAEGRETFRYYLEKIKARVESLKWRDEAIVEVRLVSSDGRIINERKTKIPL